MSNPTFDPTLNNGDLDLLLAILDDFTSRMEKTVPFAGVAAKVYKQMFSNLDPDMGSQIEEMLNQIAPDAKKMKDDLTLVRTKLILLKADNDSAEKAEFVQDAQNAAQAGDRDGKHANA